jgi:hypothetical protein
MWKTSLENLSPPLANPLLLGEGSGFIFFRREVLNSPPFLLGKGAGGLGLGLVFPDDVKSQVKIQLFTGLSVGMLGARVCFLAPEIPPAPPMKKVLVLTPLPTPLYPP